MSVLNITPDELDAIKGQIDGKISEFETVLQSIESNNNALTEAWVGDDITKYTSAVQVQMNALKQFSEVLTSISNTLAAVSTAFRDDETENASHVNI